MPSQSRSSHRAADERVAAFARDLYGRLAVQAGPGIAVHMPGGHPYAVHLSVRDAADEPQVVACASIALALDWGTSGLGDFLLRENGDLACGRLVREGEALFVEHTAIADGLTRRQLAFVVEHVAVSARRVAETLRSAGVVAADWD